MEKKLTSQIASPSDRENIVFEIYEEIHQVAEISNEPGEGFRIEIFSSPNGSWNLDIDAFEKLIEKGKRSISQI